ncbi:MAG: hypothetical protein JRI55_35915 [Deltaproteobacteria bacterium]|jgi:hypothetical protein|nr:hypothetical protein [Deltaproteobacteria bacterium]
MARIITLARLNRALRRAIDDFSVCGLYTAELHAVPVRLTYVGWAYGYCWNTGEIYNPGVSIEQNTHGTSPPWARREARVVSSVTRRT